MHKTVSIALILGCILASTRKLDLGKQSKLADRNNDLQSELDQLAASEQHRSWCSFKAGSSKIWCKTKALATTNSAQRKINLALCDGAYKVNLLACPQRRLSNSLLTSSPKHRSWCSFKANAALSWCKTKAYTKTSTAQRNDALKACNYVFNSTIVACPARRLDAFLESGAQKHKSWCTFKAFTNKSWCKTKALSLNAAVRNSGYQACDNQYNFAVARCAQRRLMKDFEESVHAGSAAESWCAFKNRSKWLWCKASKSINTNKGQRAANLANCDAAYSQGSELCNNQLAIGAVNTSGN